MYLIHWYQTNSEQNYKKKIETFQGKENFLVTLMNISSIEKIEVWEKLEDLEKVGTDKDHWLRNIHWRFLREIITPSKIKIKSEERRERKK